MRVAYLYNRPVSEGDAMDCEKTFADWKGTNRTELVYMIERGGVRSGDTLCLRALSDLGPGQESTRHQNTLREMGVTIEVIPAKDGPREKGRPPRAAFKSIDDWEAGCSLWYSPAAVRHAVQRISERVGASVDRNWCNNQCGPRDGTKKQEKRAAMLKRLED